MTLTIHDTLMTSNQTRHTARQEPSRNGWEVSWLPGVDHAAQSRAPGAAA